MVVYYAVKLINSVYFVVYLLIHITLLACLYIISQVNQATPTVTIIIITDTITIMLIFIIIVERHLTSSLTVIIAIITDDINMIVLTIIVTLILYSNSMLTRSH